MSQVDNRNSTAGKRARTDGGRREDDWTCPSCGNVNFSFRMTCNMRNCDQSRPVDHNSKPMIQRQLGSLHLQTPPRYTIYNPAPPPYSSLYSSAPTIPPPFDHHHHRHLPPPLPPYSGGASSPYPPPHYYAGRVSSGLGSPHHHHLPYSIGSMFGSGGMYGMPPLADRYGLALHAGHGSIGARPGLYDPYLDESSEKETAGEGRENDWICPACGNVNFSFRTVCNMRKCNTPRPENAGPKSENSKGSEQQKTPEGSWKCEKCENINYPYRTKCNRQNCGAERPINKLLLTEQEKTPEGSWKCEKCENINYPYRTKCNRQTCGAERPTDSSSNPNPNSNSLSSPDQFGFYCLTKKIELKRATDW
ncbi:hypothetical protein LUZ60_008725 [Juncus effusus]|nr:hypothetical protein LUZ60_008725 [Juncus effusus]